MSKALSTASEDALKGQQLTAQYHRATGGMREVLVFGAMMLQLRAEHPELAQRGNPKLQLSKRGQLDGETPLPLSKWLETHAPEVKRTTALRFLAVTESVAAEYTAIVGPKVAKSIDLATLVTTPAKKLDGKLAAKQLELFEWVNGTSQRSWLDRFSPKRNTPPKPTKQSAKNRKANAEDEALQAARLVEAAEEMIANMQDFAAAFDECKKALSLDELAAWENAAAPLVKAAQDEIKARRAAK